MLGAELVNVRPDSLSSTIEFLTAMVTPTLLISATCSLVLPTSTRLGRVVDRVRSLEIRLGEMIYAEDKSEIPLYEKRVEVIVELIDKVTSRSRILQKAMAAFYYGLMFFILTSVTIAVAALLGIYRWLPIPFGGVGVMVLFSGRLRMMRGTRMPAATIDAEMGFSWALARQVAPKEVASKYAAKGRRKGTDTAKLKGKNESSVSNTLGGE